MKTKPSIHDIVINSRIAIPRAELGFSFSRSGGPGGQNVNKVSSRVTLTFDVASSSSLGEEDKARILRSLRSRIDASGVLRIDVQESRSQWRNREEAVERFSALLQRALAHRKKRVPTKVSKMARENRLLRKKRHSSKKQGRKGVEPE